MSIDFRPISPGEFNKPKLCDLCLSGSVCLKKVIYANNLLKYKKARWILFKSISKYDLKYNFPEVTTWAWHSLRVIYRNSCSALYCLLVKENFVFFCTNNKPRRFLSSRNQMSYLFVKRILNVHSQRRLYCVYYRCLSSSFLDCYKTHICGLA